MRGQRLKTEIKEYLYSVGRNWVSSGKPLDKVVEDFKNADIIAVSAGTVGIFLSVLHYSNFSFLLFNYFFLFRS